MKKKLSLILLITIISFFSVSSEVFAVTGYGSGNGKVVGAKITNPDIGRNNFEQGIRISIYSYDKNKRSLEKKGHSIDIMRTKSDYDWFVATKFGQETVSHYRAFSNGNLMSKFDYIDKYKKKGYYDGKYPKDRNLDEIAISLDKILDNDNDNNKNSNKYLYYIYNNKLYNENGIVKVNNKELDSLSYVPIWGNEVISNSNNNFKTSFLNFLKAGSNYKNLFQLMGVNNYSCSDTYIIVEPIGTFYEKIVKGKSRKRFAGTAYELIAYQSIFSLSNIIPALPLSLYVTGNQNDEKNVPFINGYLQTISVNENTKKVNEKNTWGQNGYGMNIFWLKDLESCQVSECQYTPQYFEDKNNDNKPDYTYTDASGTTRDCCYYFSHDPNKKDTLVEDFEICGSCPANTVQTTIYDKNSNDDTISNPDSSGRSVDTSNRCSLGNGNNPTINGKKSDYIVNDYLPNGIDNNTCLTLTSTVNNDASTKITERQINQYCSIKCLEEDTFNIPSNPLVTVQTYHFVWPTSPSTTGKFGNKWPLTAEGKISCRIIVKAQKLKTEKNATEQNNILNQCASFGHVDVKNINTFNPTIKLEHNGSEVGTLTKYNETLKCTSNYNNVNCSELSSQISLGNNNFDTKVNILRSFRFTITRTMGYGLGKEINGKIYKSTGTTKTSNTNETSYPVGYGNIPITFASTTKSFTYVENLLVQGKLKILISNISDHFNQNNLNLSCNADYSAKYDSTNSGGKYNDEYKCGPGTPLAGKILTDCVNSGKTVDACAVDPIKGCFGENKHYCSPATSCSLKCTTNDENCCLISNSDWDNIYNNKFGSESDSSKRKELTQDYFDNSEICNGDNGNGNSCPMDLPIETCYPGKDITSCVREKTNSGISEIDALNQCIDSECCNLNPPDKILLVRTIDLNNPFPSISGITDLSGDKLGRLPGYNWRTSESLIKENQNTVLKVITNNRGVETTEVYKKTPLYTFNLNADTINKIRTEVNRTRSYDDYSDLECDKDMRRCISGFVHNTRYGFVDNTSSSTCAGVSHSSFMDCLE